MGNKSCSYPENILLIVKVVFKCDNHYGLFSLDVKQTNDIQSNSFDILICTL